MAVVMATFSHPPFPPLLSFPCSLFRSQINSNALKCHCGHSKDAIRADEYKKQETERRTEHNAERIDI